MRQEKSGFWLWGEGGGKKGEKKKTHTQKNSKKNEIGGKI